MAAHDDAQRYFLNHRRRRETEAVAKEEVSTICDKAERVWMGKEQPGFDDCL